MSGEEDVPPPAEVAWYRWPMVQLRRLYRWTLSWAETRYAVPALAVLAFVEASFFPIPPDVLLLPICLGRPRRSLAYAGVCTAFSVLGGVLGWYIGASLWQSLGTYAECSQYGGGGLLFEYVPNFTCHNFERVQRWYHDYDAFALFVAAFTPIPYKVFTIAAGALDVSLVTMVLASIAGRGARFFLVAGLVWKFGPRVREFIEKRFELLTVGFTILLIGGFLLIKLIS